MTRRRMSLVLIGCTSVAVLTWLLSQEPGSDHSAVKAEEPKAESLKTRVVEYGPKRGEPEFQTHRNKTASGEIYYGIYWGGWHIAEDDAAAILRFYSKYKEKAKPENKLVEDAKITLMVKDAGSGENRDVSFDLREKKWWWGGYERNDALFESFATAVKELEELKKVPFSVEP